MRALLCVLLSACGPAAYGVPPDDPTAPDAASTTTPPPAGCTGNNDGKIDRSELAFPLGVPVTFIIQSGSVAMNPNGDQQGGQTVWDLSNATGSPTSFTLAPPAGWYAPHFPDARYVAPMDAQATNLGLFTVTDGALLNYGYASQSQNTTLAVYDHPLALVQFPIADGQSYTQQGTIWNGTFNGIPFSSLDIYRIQTGPVGTLVLPNLRLPNTIRVRTDLSQSLPGGLTQTHIQYSFFHECLGEVARMTSNADELNANFQTGAELRILGGP
jgi:hypothetical protein